MPDPYAAIADVDKTVQEKLGDVLELRGADRQQKELLQYYLSLVDLKDNSSALEVGCGTGVVSRYLSSFAQIDSVTGIDPSAVFIDKANELSKDIPGASFRTGDARALDFADESFDLVVFHTSLCHVPGPEKALNEAYRVLRPGGTLAIFEGDYASATVAVDNHDPLQMVVDKMVENFVENKWLARQLPKFLTELGLEMKDFRSHGYTGVSDPSYMLTLIDRGVDIMVNTGVLGKKQAEALQSEAQRRVESGEFFGQISYISAISKKSG